MMNNRSIYSVFVFILNIGFTEPASAQREAAIHLNQLGFYTQGPKVAAITGGGATIFTVYNAATNDTVFKGKLSKPQQSSNSATTVQRADFSALLTNGTFKLYVPGVGTSFSFDIGPIVLRPIAVAALKGFYFMRSDVPLEATFAGAWQRPAGHPDTVVYVHPSAADAAHASNSIISSPGGWYDAGDYNKYIVNSGITMGTLLSAYEDYKKYFDTLHTQISESTDAVPDLLNEVLYNLRWMLTMQDAVDGGVYHKCTNAAFDGMVMPGQTKSSRYVVQKSTAATLDFAAVTAQAARIFPQFEKYLPGLADSCLSASIKAWQWAVLHPDVVYDQLLLNKLFVPAISTGAYGDKKLSDEWFWASAELFATTKNAFYLEKVQKHFPDSVLLPSWSDVAMLGHYTLLRMQKQLPVSAKPLVARAKAQIVNRSNAYLATMSKNVFRVVMGGSRRDFIWGSNAVAANQGVLLVNAFLHTRNKSYLAAALSNADYLLGRNATGYCFVTGSGSKSPLHPHHRPSIADGVAAPVPGLLSGGPNPGRQDSCTYAFTEPETAFSDTDCSYASNEVAINWNAPLVYLTNALEALATSLSKK